MEFPLRILLEIAQLPRAPFYYHLKRQSQPDKYADAKTAIETVYHEDGMGIDVLQLGFATREFN